MLCGETGNGYVTVILIIISPLIQTLDVVVCSAAFTEPGGLAESIGDSNCIVM